MFLLLCSLLLLELLSSIPDLLIACLVPFLTLQHVGFVHPTFSQIERLKEQTNFLKTQNLINRYQTPIKQQQLQGSPGQSPSLVPGTARRTGRKGARPPMPIQTPGGRPGTLGVFHHVVLCSRRGCLSVCVSLFAVPQLVCLFL